MAYRRKTFRKKTGGRKKGWFASANLGPMGKYSIGYNKRALKNIVKREINSSKLYTNNPTLANTKHSTIYTYNPLSQITQGVTNSTRIGDAIYLKSILCRHVFDLDFSGLPAGVAKIGIRYMLVRLEQQYTNATWASGVGASDLFLNTGSPEFSLVDYRKASVLCDKTVTYNSQTGTNSGKVQQQYTMHCKINKTFTYQGSGGTYGKYNNLYLLAIPFCSTGVTGTTTIQTGLNSQISVSFTDA